MRNVSTMTPLTTSKAAQGLLPQIEAAIAFLQQEVAEIRAGTKDGRLHDLIKEPLPREQFQALLQVWKLPPVPVELSKLFMQLEQVRLRQQKQEEEEDEEMEELVPVDTDEAQDEVMTDEKTPEETVSVDEEEEDKPKTEDTSVDVKEEDEEEEKEPPKPRKPRGRPRKRPLETVEASGVSSDSDARSASVERKASVDESVEKQDEPQPEEVVEKTLEDAEEEEKTASPVPATPPQPVLSETEQALANLRALRKGMMLDVLSKIVSVAKSKGVDPAMFSSRQSSGSERYSFVDLQMIEVDVGKGVIAEWEHFAQQVYLFCQHVIAESEKQDQQDAKQKGVELLHFAKTLTETLRKASLKREESLMQKTDVVATRPSIIAPVATPTPPARPSVEAAVESAAADSSKAPETPPVAGNEVQTPHRMSARLRQRENSLSDSPSPQRRRASRDEEGEGETSRTRKRVRISDAVSSPVGTPTNTATPTDDLSEYESQMSTSETAPTSNENGDSDSGKRRSRKRKPVAVVATRVSSRQMKRRAAEAAAAAAAAAAEDGSDAQENEESEEDDGTATESENAAPSSPPPEKNVPLTKAGRPRKKPGRKPKKQSDK
ncbi:hypothetical protein Poli38472_010682 [Pythium oligandrum]|uniref:Uncharacterized protein n=1 Tax=Pythium oligandrum TaxID=41045 RepID=A0A8K1FI21_PYTOL|nr:hypothetical protein Poli38472_010682 [Pythium oligandrum]|eukprot:TMW61619.1 hypothetical protein Poli38472_010682 [Pythium oligandrum]